MNKASGIQDLLFISQLFFLSPGTTASPGLRISRPLIVPAGPNTARAPIRAAAQTAAQVHSQGSPGRVPPGDVHQQTRHVPHAPQRFHRAVHAPGDLGR